MEKNTQVAVQEAETTTKEKEGLITRIAKFMANPAKGRLGKNLAFMGAGAGILAVVAALAAGGKSTDESDEDIDE